MLSTLGAAHFAAASAAVLFGFVVLVERKGTAAHRAFGGVYVMAMIVLNITALGVYRITGQFGPFHALALFSLLVVVRGVVVALRRRPGWLARHYYLMNGSYLGLMAALCAEIVARVPPLRGLIASGSQAIVLGVSIAGVFLLIGVIVLPRLRARALAGVSERLNPS